MTTRDSTGYALSGATVSALEHYDQATQELRCYIGDPVGSVDRALAAAPAMTMGHALRAWLHLLGTEPSGLPVARASLTAALALPATERERGHLEAIRLVLNGQWRAAGCVLEDVSAAYPHDALALQAGHQIDFFTGDSRMLRDRVARVLPAWDDAVPGYHAVLGMYAFGLEETADYARAEQYGRESVSLEPRDGWGWHAVAHVMEMCDESPRGIAWLRSGSDAWSRESFFAVHNWWHLALFYLDVGDVDEALRLFDGPLHAGRSAVVLDNVDAASLLWRFHLRGVDVGERWQAVADSWAGVTGACNYAFNDCHAMMAFTAADRPKAQAAILDSLMAEAASGGDVAAFAREVGLPVARAIQAFGDRRYGEAVRLLRSVRHHAHRFGGSHAQRDLIDLTLIEAALRASNQPLALALARERAARRPESPLARALVRRATVSVGPKIVAA